MIRDVAATTAGQTQPPAPWRRRIGDRAALLGPAFVAAIAYVDPGNVAANLQAGSRYGYLLVWVLVVAIAAAGIVQFLSAKLGLATGKSLPDLVGERLGRKSRLAYWVQAEGVAMATDLAEVIGGAIALVSVVRSAAAAGRRDLRRGVPLPAVGAEPSRSKDFRAGDHRLPADHRHRVHGRPVRRPAVGRRRRRRSGAQVRRHRLGAAGRRDAGSDGDAARGVSALGPDPRPVRPDRTRSPSPATDLRRPGPTSYWRCCWPGAVNISMLLLAASGLRGLDDVDTIEGAHAAISGILGPVVGMLFAVGLLASGLASTSVGSYAGSA